MTTTSDKTTRQSSKALLFFIFALFSGLHIYVFAGDTRPQDKVHFSKNSSQTVSIRMRLTPPTKLIKKTEKQTVKRKKGKNRSKSLKQQVARKMQHKTTSDKGQVTALASYLKKVRNEIESNRSYPRLSRRLRHQGTAVVEFILKNDGSFSAVKLKQKTKFEALNQAALNGLMKVKRFDSFPKGIEKKQFAIAVPVVFKLL